MTRRARVGAPATGALVTGAGRGLGREIARVLAGRGFAVHVTDLDGASAARTADHLNSRAWSSALDVSDASACERAARATAERTGALAVWVNNAGVLPVGQAWEHDDDERRAAVETNALGTMNGTLAALALMRPAGYGHVVNVVSLAGLVTPPGQVLYAASKHAALAFSLGTALDLRLAGERGVHVSALCPDAMRTPMLAEVADSPAAALSWSGAVLRPERVAERVGRLLDRPRPLLSVPRWRGGLLRAYAGLPRLASRVQPAAVALARRRQRAQSSASWRATELGTMRELTLSRSSLRCYERGSGPTLVFVHGVLVNANVWRGVVARLAPSFRCVTLDLPLGSHTVPVPDADRTPTGVAAMIAEAIAALGLRDVVLVGNDTGGALCQLVVARAPDCVARLVLTSCEFRENCPPPVFRPMSQFARVPGGLLAYLVPGLLPPLQRLPLAYGWLAKRPLDPRAAASYTRPAVTHSAIRRDLAAFLRDYTSRHTTAAAEALPRFTRPVLVAWSREDRVFPPRHGQALAGLLPTATLRWIDDAYALSPEDRPEVLAAAIAEFSRRSFC